MEEKGMAYSMIAVDGDGRMIFQVILTEERARQILFEEVIAERAHVQLTFGAFPSSIPRSDVNIHTALKETEEDREVEQPHIILTNVPRKNKCKTCGMPGHIAKTCPEKPKEDGEENEDAYHVETGPPVAPTSAEATYTHERGAKLSEMEYKDVIALKEEGADPDDIQQDTDYDQIEIERALKYPDGYRFYLWNYKTGK